jgi:hypothetical protein
MVDGREEWTTGDVTTRMDRLVCVTPRVRVGMVVWQLARDPALGYPRDALTLRVVAASHPVLSLEGHRPVWAARPMDPERDLGERDLKLVRALRGHDAGLTLVEVARALGMPLPEPGGTGAGGPDAEGLRVWLHTTPFVVALTGDRYRLATRHDDPATTPDILRPPGTGPTPAGSDPGATVH